MPQAGLQPQPPAVTLLCRGINPNGLTGATCFLTRARLSGVVSPDGAVKGGKLPGGKCHEQNSGRRGDQFWGDQGWRETLAAPRSPGS